ncbi:MULTISPECIES: HugZ family protein [Alphaproteobacteria]|uniref:Pyridoxamine oxidase n=2 Tax=Alphaproteobacteria TaxID=28211 RepID=A0A512HEY3_9HYPH|nr:MULTISPECIES: pyridoxamine 5'-phosphate oxidase family protein [Alphaproteobacteria]GEO84012.1 pyridoxamine oxidase [Ciceribacter naphthalenivorans]GLR21110.1 pyridoxamine oxidase [Ciceribacter naphthalenivorans]GLT03966.1 pyridoxamine oxidase [Sphingomonas psychrolutea]
MNDKPSVIRETDDEARGLARRLLRSARFVALAVIDPQTHFPSVSRVLIGTDTDGVPVILVSQLSAHTRALDADNRVSLLAGEPGKGDPLAHPRLTLQCVAEPVERDGAAHDRLRTRFIDRHPKAKLYIDFPDFRFFRLVPKSASLNGGFGRAYLLPGEDFLIPSEPSGEVSGNEAALLQDLASARPELAAQLATGPCGKKPGKWLLCGLDRAGIDIISGDLLVRYDFRHLIESKADLYSLISNIEYRIP